MKQITKSVIFDIEIVEALEKERKKHQRSFSGQVNYVCEKYIKNLK